LKKRIYIFKSGELKRKENTLIFTDEENVKKMLPLEAIEEIAIFGEVTLNKRLLEFLNKKHVVIHFFNHYGWDIGSFYPREYLNSGFILLKQVEFYLDEEKRFTLSSLFVNGSISNILKNLKYYKNHNNIELNEEISSMENLKRSLKDAKTIDELRAIEGNSKRIYYKSFNKILENSLFEIKRRERRPPKNPMNALISFGNSLMYTTALSAVFNTNLDPRIGYLHSTNDRSFSLNLDIADIFKPVISDRVVFTLINKGMLGKKDFEKTIDYTMLKEKGRKIFIQEFENKLNTTIKLKKLNKKVSYKRLIRIECYKLYKHFTGEEEYSPFIGEW